ncbi:ribonuclease HI-related protein [Sporolactobacillus inulinus]|uniref:Ribonuclease HI-related protein n=1 Tax=Sporolactobacillus inulinus TaxID=2078 RepID=A0A4Y1ZI68_9BACL|nr:RNase H family protein [Sporolactobacillus inulinus]GAY78719.1 ribonuclease HI-related protein [Sporolactobacillus inulinus]
MQQFGYTFRQTVGILNNRISGLDNQNPTYHVIFSNEYSGVFSSQEMRFISNKEQFIVNKKFYLEESAINFFKKNIDSYLNERYYLVISERVQGIFTDIDKLQPFVDTDTVIKEFDDLLTAEKRLKNYIKRQKKKAGYIVIFSKNFSGIFNIKEKSLIPKHESIYYEMRFKSEKEAIDDFLKNEAIYHKKTYYVIQSNRISGIFSGLELVKPFTKDGMDVTIKKHNTIKEARAHFEQLKELNGLERQVVAYVDGSYCSKTMLSGFAFLLVAHHRVIFEDRGASFCDNDMKHLNGELEAVMNSILKAIDLGFTKIIIRYDASVILSWSNKESQRVRSNNSRLLSKQYHEFINRTRAYINIDFEKVKAHTHKYYNDRVDYLAKQAAGNRTLEATFDKRSEYFRK